MAGAERRRRTELKRIRLMDEKLKMEEHRLRMEMRKYNIEMEEGLRQWRPDMLDEKNDDRSKTMSCPLLFEDHSPSQDSATFPPRLIVLKSIEQVIALRQSKQSTARGVYSGLSSICTEEHHQDLDNIENNEISAPPHIIVVKEISDDEEDKGLDSIWMDNIDNDEISAPTHIVAMKDVSDDEDDEVLDSIWANQPAKPGQGIEINHSLQPHPAAECQPSGI
mmetsp:Transcript_25064/g.47941  ORF Transcript_25064/g.47941 Transcript_25064/m.47941 type:complete len:222 (-) Transcript_25064:376-1041(-)